LEKELLSSGVMKIEIFGAGMAGCYLACLLERSEHNYKIYEKYKNSKCPSPCAFGWANYSKVKKLCNLIDVDSDSYVLMRPKEAIVNGIDFKIRDVVIFDKPRFINDMRKSLDVVYEVPNNYSGDLIVDATGHSRALLRGVDIKYLVTKQYRAKVSKLDSDCIYIYAKPYGYAWAFPLSKDEWHIGAGGFTQEQVNFLIGQLNKTYEIKFNDIECACKSPIIWDYTVSYFKQIYGNNIVGIGEAGGFVSAFGEGNTLALETAKCLHEAIEYGADDIDLIIDIYSDLVWKETSWVIIQYDFVETLNESWFKALFKVRDVIKVANMRNLDASVWKGLKLMWRLRK